MSLFVFLVMYTPVVMALAVVALAVCKLGDRLEQLRTGVPCPVCEAEDDARFMQELSEFSDAAERRVQELKALAQSPRFPIAPKGRMH